MLRGSVGGRQPAHSRGLDSVNKTSRFKSSVRQGGEKGEVEEQEVWGREKAEEELRGGEEERGIG